MKPYVISAATGFLAPLALPLPALPEDWPSWVQWAIALASGILGPAFAWLAARALKALISALRRRAVTQQKIAELLLSDANADNDAEALRLLREADFLHGIADGLADEKTQKAALAALKRGVTK